jgi:hypothetical protein
MCKLVYYLHSWSGICSIMTLTFLAIQRYYAAVRPLYVRSLWTRRRTRIWLVLIWCVSAAFAVPIWFGQILVSVGRDGDSYYWCIKEFDDDWMMVAFDAYMFVLLVVIPLLFMISMYSYVLYKLPRSDTHEIQHYSAPGMPGLYSNHGSRLTSNLETPSSSAKQVHSATDGCRQRYRRVLRLLVLSVLVFAICWTPYQTDQLLSSLGIIGRFNIGWLKPYRMATTLLAHANACINPCVYCFMSTNFR